MFFLSRIMVSAALPAPTTVTPANNSTVGSLEQVTVLWDSHVDIDWEKMDDNYAGYCGEVLNSKDEKVCDLTAKSAYVGLQRMGIILLLPKSLTEDGTYKVKLHDVVYAFGENGMQYNEPQEFSYTIDSGLNKPEGGETENPENLLSIKVSPADGTVEYGMMSDRTLTFDTSESISSTITSVVFKNENGKLVSAWLNTSYLAYGEATVYCDGITEPGTWTMTIPAGAFVSESGKTNKETSFTYILKANEPVPALQVLSATWNFEDKTIDLLGDDATLGFLCNNVTIPVVTNVDENNQVNRLMLTVKGGDVNKQYFATKSADNKFVFEMNFMNLLPLLKGTDYTFSFQAQNRESYSTTNFGDPVDVIVKGKNTPLVYTFDPQPENEEFIKAAQMPNITISFEKPVKPQVETLTLRYTKSISDVKFYDAPITMSEDGKTAVLDCSNLKTSGTWVLLMTPRIFIADDEDYNLDAEYNFRYTYTASTGIDTIAADAVKVSCQAGELVICGAQAGELVAIYNAQGACVAQVKANNNGMAQVSLAKGLYLVKVAGKAVKVLNK